MFVRKSGVHFEGRCSLEEKQGHAEQRPDQQSFRKMYIAFLEGMQSLPELRMSQVLLSAKFSQAVKLTFLEKTMREVLMVLAMVTAW